jgi:hypothetical protein
MLKMAMSKAAAALLRALLHRAGDQRSRILLSDICSVDWQSLTLAGERHVIGLRIGGPDAARTAAEFVDGIEEAEFDLPGYILADIAITKTPRRDGDGSMVLELEALTVVE